MFPIVDIFKKNRWHFITWGIILFLNLLIGSNFGWEYILKNGLVNTIGIMTIVYTNIYVLLPRFLKPGGVFSILYSLLTIFMVIVFVILFCHIYEIYLYPLIKDEFFHGAEFRPMFPVFKYMAIFLISLFLSTSIFISFKGKEAKIKWEKVLLEKKDIELKYLRGQINPHFLFNTLNNVYSQVYMKEEGAADNILKLSDMLRYIIDDCAENTVPLQKEIDYLHNFIDFQNLKSETPLNISFKINAENPNIELSPLLFIPIVENCFKHGKISSDPDSFVTIDLHQVGDKIEFKTVNSITSNNHENSGREGIGINNLRKRLELVYTKNHILNFKKEDNKFIVEMIIYLKS
ncbi:histidine kinase [Halosquirtibacter xylanolyticus]|uniref:sensor histidine kinase n=1 Tax=Halosquirtibacter xylanolyticus TaxID=3374599 RepID=UPI003748E310|nr:histidine kinase [Prolixibacteraceae bacterium]